MQKLERSEGKIVSACSHPSIFNTCFLQHPGLKKTKQTKRKLTEIKNLFSESDLAKRAANTTVQKKKKKKNIHHTTQYSYLKWHKNAGGRDRN